MSENDEVNNITQSVIVDKPIVLATLQPSGARGTKRQSPLDVIGHHHHHHHHHNQPPPPPPLPPPPPPTQSQLHHDRTNSNLIITDARFDPPAAPTNVLVDSAALITGNGASGGGGSGGSSGSRRPTINTSVVSSLGGVASTGGTSGPHSPHMSLLYAPRPVYSFTHLPALANSISHWTPPFHMTNPNFGSFSMEVSYQRITFQYFNRCQRNNYKYFHYAFCGFFFV